MSSAYDFGSTFRGCAGQWNRQAACHGGRVWPEEAIMEILPEFSGDLLLIAIGRQGTTGSQPDGSRVSLEPPARLFSWAERVRYARRPAAMRTGVQEAIAAARQPTRIHRASAPFWYRKQPNGPAKPVWTNENTEHS